MPGDWLRSLVVLLLFLPCGWTCPQHCEPNSPTQVELLTTIKVLYQSEEWEAILRQVSTMPVHVAEMDYYQGMALARLQRWQDASQAFERGEQKAPTDKRFPLELAGVSFKMRNLSKTKAHLRRALKLDPKDSYGQDFLATVFFLEGNLDAAIKHWNQVGKPVVEEIRMVPLPQLKPDLLDRAFAFAPAGQLKLEDFRTTQSWLDLLEIYPHYRFELLPRQNNAFDVLFSPAEKNGWGDNKIEGLLSMLRGVPYQTIYPEFYNLRRSALNSLSLVRWDAQKRRISSSFSGPWGGNPRWRYQLLFDGRKENWDLTSSFQGPIPPAGDLRLQKQSVGAEMVTQWSERWKWWSSVEVAHRKFLSPPLVDDRYQLFPRGTSLKYQTGFDHELVQNPERRFTASAFTGLDIGKMLVTPRTTFAKYEGGVHAQWLPRAEGNDYATSAQFRSGIIQGDPPFDELFILGLERDNDLWMRGHIGTRHGKKGASPLGRSYVLFNGEFDKIVYRHAFFDIKVGPFLDSGKAFDKSGTFGSRVWLWDLGAQVKLRILGGTTFIFSYGKDLQTGRNAFYFTTSR